MLCCRCTPLTPLGLIINGHPCLAVLPLSCYLCGDTIIALPSPHLVWSGAIIPLPLPCWCHCHIHTAAVIIGLSPCHLCGRIFPCLRHIPSCCSCQCWCQQCNSKPPALMSLMTSFHPVWYTSVPDFPKNNIFSVVPYSTLQLVCNSSKKNLILQTLECKKGVCYMELFWVYILANIGLFSLICFVTSFFHL